MEPKRPDRARISPKAGVPLGLVVVQLVLGYEWLMSGLAKLVHGDFPGGLAGNLAARSAEAPGWFRGFLDGTVAPRARAFGYLVESAELLTGLVLVATALAFVLSRQRLPRGGVVAVLAGSAAAAAAGFAMNVAFHLANGSGEPFLLPSDSFEEAVDLDSVMAALELVLLAVSLMPTPPKS